MQLSWTAPISAIPARGHPGSKRLTGPADQQLWQRRGDGLQTITARLDIVILTCPNDVARMPRTCDCLTHILRCPGPCLLVRAIDYQIPRNAHVVRSVRLNPARQVKTRRTAPYRGPLPLYEHALHHVVVLVFDDVAVVYVLLRGGVAIDEHGARRRELGAHDCDLPRVRLHRGQPSEAYAAACSLRVISCFSGRSCLVKGLSRSDSSVSLKS